MHQAHPQVLFRVWNADMPWFAGVSKNMMTSLYSTQNPSIRLKLPDDLLAVHGSYYNHLTNKVNTITTN